MGVAGKVGTPGNGSNVPCVPVESASRCAVRLVHQLRATPSAASNHVQTNCPWVTPSISPAVTLYLVASAPGMLEAKAVNMVPMPAVVVGM